MTVARLQILPGTELMVYESFAGFAADGVERVAVIDAEDRLVPMAEVVGNVFHSANPPDPVKAVAALDVDGEVIWRGPSVPPPDE